MGKCSIFLAIREMFGNQHYTEIPSHPSQNGYHQENKKSTNAGEDVRGGTLTYSWEEPLHIDIN
jgi:hypothetical protein